MDHPHSCRILDFGLDMQRCTFSVYHVLEALDRDVEKDIEDRKPDSARGRRSQNVSHADSPDSGLRPQQANRAS